MSGLEGLLTGRTLVKRYHIEEVIGRGGFAVVYRATDQSLGRTVAVKVITAPAPDPETRAENRGRFQREARAAASLSHPNVVTVHDFGTDPTLDIDFLVMEFLHGEDLATHLSGKGRPSLDLALCILTDAAKGLAVGHRAGLVHRDVKPGNLFLAEPHGQDPFRVCVLDFGIARAAAADHTVTRLTQGGVALSPAYASPEQARGERELTPASDVFSLGVVGYQLLTGEKPFPAERTFAPEEWVPARGVREMEPSVPEQVEAVIRKAMSYAPGDRFADAAAMARALDDAVKESEAPVAAPAVVVAAAVPEPPEDATMVQTEPVSAAPPPPPPPRAREPATRPAPAAPRRSPVPAWALLLLLLVGAGAVGVFALGGGDGDSAEVDGAGAALPQVPDGGGAEGAPEEVVVEEPSAAGAVASPEPAVAGSPAPATGTAPAAAPTGPRPSATAPAPGGAPVVQRPATARPLPAAQPPAARPPAPAAQQPRQPAPQPAPAPQQPAPADSTPQPRLLGEPVRRPDPQPVPRDTASRPRSDTTVTARPAPGDSAVRWY